MNMHKIGLVIFVVVALGLFANASIAQEKKDIPQHLKLATDKERILGKVIIPGNGEKPDTVKYAYRSNNRVSANPGDLISQAANKASVNIKQEDVSKRTRNARTFITSTPGVKITEIISGVPQYYQDTSGEWWEADYATTTLDSFNLQMNNSLLDKIVSFFFGEKAYATEDTFYPAAGSNSPVDGRTIVDYSLASGVDWSTIISDTGDLAADTDIVPEAYIIRSDNVSNKWRGMVRSIFLFNTSSISDGDTITSATLSLYGNQTADGNYTKADNLGISPDVNIYSANPASDSTLTGADYSSIGSTPFSTAVSYADQNANDSYEDFPFNAAGIAAINKAGISKFATRNANYDVANNAPTWSSSAESRWPVRGSDTSGTTSDPKLVVVHVEPIVSADDNNIFFSSDASLTADRYMGPQQLCTTGNRVDCEIIIPQDILAKSMSCFMENGTTGNNAVFTLYDDGSPTSISASTTGVQIGTIIGQSATITANSLITILADEVAGTISGHAACTVRYSNIVP